MIDTNLTFTLNFIFNMWNYNLIKKCVETVVYHHFQNFRRLSILRAKSMFTWFGILSVFDVLRSWTDFKRNLPNHSHSMGFIDSFYISILLFQNRFLVIRLDFGRLTLRINIIKLDSSEDATGRISETSHLML